MRSTTHSIVAAAVVLALAGPMATRAPAQEGAMNMGNMGGENAANVPRVPPVAGYAAGERIYFIHTEVSDPEIGAVMTEMMNSPVPVVPALAQVTGDLVATVFVFSNGVRPGGPRGPLGYQPDVFDHPAGTAGYRPLRRIAFVTWSDPSEARILTSAASVEGAIEAGEITVSASDVVANMPFLTWPGGSR